MKLSELNTAPVIEDTVGWYIINNAEDSFPDAGPFETYSDARRASQGYSWYREEDFDIAYGRTDPTGQDFHDLKEPDKQRSPAD